jgi:hypothetical protein
MGCGARFREKSLAISNAFRQALGLSFIEAENKMHILPFVGTPPTFVEVGPNGVDGKAGGRGNGIHPHHHHHHGFKRKLANKPFLARVHLALMALGPWEGRAVAFVLGCGLGVLLRMFFVLVVISYRAIRGEREERGYQRLPLSQYGSEAVPSPQYVIDEKPPIVEEPSAAEAN